jgi:hypothetical protein
MPRAIGSVSARLAGRTGRFAAQAARALTLVAEAVACGNGDNRSRFTPLALAQLGLELLLFLVHGIEAALVLGFLRLALGLKGLTQRLVLRLHLLHYVFEFVHLAASPPRRVRARNRSTRRTSTRANCDPTISLRAAPSGCGSRTRARWRRAPCTFLVCDCPQSTTVTCTSVSVRQRVRRFAAQTKRPVPTGCASVSTTRSLPTPINNKRFRMTNKSACFCRRQLVVIRCPAANNIVRRNVGRRNCTGQIILIELSVNGSGMSKIMTGGGGTSHKTVRTVNNPTSVGIVPVN